MRRPTITLLVALALVLGIWMDRAIRPIQAQPRPMVSCPEDAVPVGYGAYAHGLWSRYRCIARDDVGSYVHNP